MMRAILIACTVAVALVVAPHALGNPAFNSADLILIAAPVAVFLIGMRRRRAARPRKPWIQSIPEDHPDALGSLDLREREHQTWRNTPQP
jgi:hypothetical protein